MDDKKGTPIPLGNVLSVTGARLWTNLKASDHYPFRILQ
jgi:hypothetical protein